MPRGKVDDDIVRLRHMVEYGEKVIRFTKGKTRAELDTDEVLALATIHMVEIIGEAASHISNKFFSQYPGVPWNLVIGTRNRLVHGYIETDLDIIWTIVTKDLPPLVMKLKRILEERR